MLFFPDIDTSPRCIIIAKNRQPLILQVRQRTRGGLWAIPSIFSDQTKLPATLNLFVTVGICTGVSKIPILVLAFARHAGERGLETSWYHFGEQRPDAHEASCNDDYTAFECHKNTQFDRESHLKPHQRRILLQNTKGVLHVGSSIDTFPSEKKIAMLKMLATVPLSDISVCCTKGLQEDRGTHNPPRRNTPVRANFCPRDACSFQTAGIGRIMIKIPVNTLNGERIR